MTKRKQILRFGLRVAVASTLLTMTMGSGCLSFGRVAGVAETVGRNFNPCGTIIACDPIEWDLMFHDFPDYDRDPTCSIPGLCGGQWPPSGAGGGGGDAAAGGGGGVVEVQNQNNQAANQNVGLVGF